MSFCELVFFVGEKLWFLILSLDGTTACEKPLFLGSFLFLSTFFIQVLITSYKLQKQLSTSLWLFFYKPVYNFFIVFTTNAMAAL